MQDGLLVKCPPGKLIKPPCGRCVPNPQSPIPNPQSPPVRRSPTITALAQPSRCCFTLRHAICKNKKRTGKPVRFNSQVVREKGLEPPRLSAPDPKSGASAIPPLPQNISYYMRCQSQLSSLEYESTKNLPDSHLEGFVCNGDPPATRTRDTLIKSQVLYRLS